MSIKVGKMAQDLFKQLDREQRRELKQLAGADGRIGLRETEKFLKNAAQQSAAIPPQPEVNTPAVVDLSNGSLALDSEPLTSPFIDNTTDVSSAEGTPVSIGIERRDIEMAGGTRWQRMAGDMVTLNTLTDGDSGHSTFSIEGDDGVIYREDTLSDGAGGTNKMYSKFDLNQPPAEGPQPLAIASSEEEFEAVQAREGVAEPSRLENGHLAMTEADVAIAATPDDTPADGPVTPTEAPALETTEAPVDIAV